MSILTALMLGIKKLFLSIFGLLRRAICCRKRQSNFEQPIQILPVRSEVVVFQEDSDEDWNNWEDNIQLSKNCDAVTINMDQDKLPTNMDSGTSSQEDYFKDMVPEFRRPKKHILKIEDNKIPTTHSSRLSMDISFASAGGSTLGLLEESSNSFDSFEELDEFWGTDALIKEMKIAERQKRIAEHQRRNQEKEATRLKKKMLPNIRSPKLEMLPNDTSSDFEHFKYT